MNAKPPQSSIRILCVDDDQDTRDLLTVVLGWAGYQVVLAATASDGLCRAKQGGFFLHPGRPDAGRKQHHDSP
jgi:CheY-like chemotaxis protein